MRLYEIDQEFDLNKATKKRLTTGGPLFTWDPAKKQWLNPDKTQVSADVHFDLMKSVGLDPRGNKLKTGVIDKIKGAWTKSGAGIDPKASALGKVMGRVGGAIGNMIGKAVRPKDADGDGQPDAQPTTPQAPNTSGAQGALSGNQAVQDLNKYVKGVAAQLTKPGTDKVALTKELVNFMADRKGSTEWENASTSIKAVLKRAGLDPKFADVALKKIQAGQTMESLQMMFINSLLEELDLTFDDLGLAESVVETEGVKHYIVEDSELVKLRKLAGI